MVAETRFYALQDFAHPALKAAIAQHFRVSGGIDLGHSYKAQRQPNGNYTLLNVDIFKACERKNAATGKVDQFNDEWMQGAQARFEELKRTGYLPPCHLDHHGKDGFSQPDAGKIGAMRIGKDAAGVSTLFADIVDIPAEVFAKMVRGRLSYRSVEVNNPDVKEISSLAFMATTVPYHKLPILQVDLDESAATFSAASQGRALFAELYSLDPKQPHLSIVQKFYGEYGGYDQPTAAMQRMARRPQQDPRGFGGQQQDGDDDQDDIQLSDDDLAQLLPLMQQQQQQGQGMQQPAQSMPGDMQGDPLEEALMGNPQLTQALMTTLQGIDQKMDAVLKGAANPAPSMPTPNPVASAQPTNTAQKFSEGAAAQSATVPQNFADAWKGLVATVETQQKTIAELKNEIGWLWAERKRDEMYSAFAEGNAHIARFKRDLIEKANFKEDKAHEYVADIAKEFDAQVSAFVEANLAEAMQNDKWREKIDVAAYFAKKQSFIPALASSAQQFSEQAKTAAAPVAQGGSAAPRSTAEAAKISPVSDADVKTFLDGVNTRDRNFIARAFSEQGEAAKTALTEAKAAWAKMTPQQQQFHDGFADYAAKMVHSASNGAAVHG